MNVIWNYNLDFVEDVLCSESIEYRISLSYNIHEVQSKFIDYPFAFAQNIRASSQSNLYFDLIRIIFTKFDVVPILERYKKLRLFI